MPPTLPHVTFVIPCFNHGAFVADAVRSCLAQTDADVRVVIVNDGSSDDSTPAACDACVPLDPARVRVIHQENRGLSAARNRGAAGATTEYLTFLDADDWVEPAFAAKLAGALETGGDGASHAYCQERLVDRATGIWAVPEWDPILLMITNLHPVTTLVRRAAFEDAGGFNESMREGYEDWDLWISFASRSLRGVRVREPLFVWRRHAEVTMVIEAVRRHERLYASLVRNHEAYYRAHWNELLVRANQMLRRADANWLDENLDAIVIRDQRKWIEDLLRERDGARARVSELDQALARAQATLDETIQTYEAKPSVRASRALHACLDRLPRPLSWPVRKLGSAFRGQTRPEP